MFILTKNCDTKKASKMLQNFLVIGFVCVNKI